MAVWNPEIKESVEEAILEYPILQYAYISPEELSFLDRVRYICRTECPQYGKSWACPPAVGSVEECRKRCMEYPQGFLFCTAAEVHDITDMEETLAARAPHEAVTRSVEAVFRAKGFETLTLSTESCAICETCSYPKEPCRHPDQMFPCVESYGILVTELAEKHGMEFMNGGNVVIWFSLILYR